MHGHAVSLMTLITTAKVEQHFRVGKYSAFEDRITSNDSVGVDNIGKERVIPPSTHWGGPRYTKQKTQDCSSLLRRNSKPEFLLATDCQEPGLGPETVVDIQVRVY